MRSLTRTLNAVQRLIEHAEDSEGEVEESEGECVLEPTAPLHLIGVVSGSAAYPVAAPDGKAALKTLSEAGESLRNPETTDWGTYLLSPIEDLSNVARSLGCNIEFRRPGKNGGVLATITPESYATLSEAAFVSGDSTIYGYLERVGGATKRHCGLRLPSQPSKMVICPVETEDLIRQLGQHVYQNVLVSGTVTWFRRNWQVKRIVVKSFQPSKTGSILQALEDVYEAGGKAWDDVVDVEAYIAEMRGA